MPKGYQQLTHEQRCQIEALNTSGLSQRKIAQQLNIHPSTISRELKRNSTIHGYCAQNAQFQCLQRRQQAQALKRGKLTAELKALINEKLALQWSPEQISGWLEQAYGHKVISHETIYQYVYKDKANQGVLYLNLRRKQRKYMKRVNGKTTRGRIIGRVDIDQRPPIVETRETFGHWEADTVVGLGHKTALVTLVERKSRYTLIVKVSRSNAELVTQAIILALQGHLVNSITFDNGKEFAYHLQIAQALTTATFFAKPYHSWERGTNENTNGLIRQYFPKKTDFGGVTDEQVANVQQLLNHRPRKCLKYNAPARVIQMAA